jgi:hypothetical protein
VLAYARVTEPATAFTDFLLAVLAAPACLRLIPRARDPHLVGAPVFFAAFGAAALLGGLHHGFANDGISGVSRLLWWLTIVCTGAAALGLAGIGLEAFWRLPVRPFFVAITGATLLFAAYAWSDSRFIVSLIATGVGSLLCVAGLVQRLRQGSRAAVLALIGLAIALLAGVLQQRRVSLHPVHFDHNATYHLVLSPALALFYAGNRRLLRHG